MRKIFILIPVLIVLLFVSAYYAFLAGKTGKEPVVACTMEALICPDGSGVGRIGPKCEFSPCPNQDSFKGELTLQGGDYRLIIESPEGSFGSTFALPVDLSQVSGYEGFIGKLVTVKGTFTSGVNLKVSTISVVDAETENQTTGELKVGETKLINRVKVTLNKIIQDSRCPTDVVCVWAGNVTLNVTLQSDTDKEILDLKSDEAPHGFDSFLVSVKDVKPVPKQGVTQDFSLYKVVFSVDNLNQ